MRSSKKLKNPKSTLRVCFGLLCMMMLVGFFGCSDSSPAPQSPDTVPATPQIKITSADTNISEEGAVSIDLNTVDRVCLISEPGAYLLSGALAGSIQIDAEDQIVHLIMDNVTVDAPAGPALEVLSAGKVILTLKDGTTNTFQDSGIYVDEPDADACIYSPCDLTINGDGSLSVSGYYKDAIHTKDVLKILNKNSFIQSKRDGLHGNDGIVVCCQDLTVQSERNGLYSTKSGKVAKGNIEIYNSGCSIIGGQYALSCAADLYIADSNVYAMGVYGNLQVLGTSYIAEGSLENA